MKKHYKSFLFVLLIIGILCVNISGVNADNQPISCDYGIICNYSLPNIADTAGGHYIGGSTLIVYYQCNDKSKKLSECSSFVSAAYASTSSLNIGSMLESGGNTADELGFQNYNNIFHQTDSFKNQFENNGQFKCPRLYYRGDKIRGVELFYSTNLPALGSHSLNDASLKLEDILKQYKTESCLVFTDMFGGSPSNISMAYLDKDTVEVVSGVNLPMLLKAFTMRMDSANTLDKIAKESAEAGRSSIKVAGELLNKK